MLARVTFAAARTAQGLFCECARGPTFVRRHTPRAGVVLSVGAVQLEHLLGDAVVRTTQQPTPARTWTIRRRSSEHETQVTPQKNPFMGNKILILLKIKKRDFQFFLDNELHFFLDDNFCCYCMSKTNYFLGYLLFRIIYERTFHENPFLNSNV